MSSILENSHPLNQLAGKKLQEAGQDPHPEFLYALQLAKWAVESRNLEPRNDSLLGNLDLMLFQWKPSEALDYLTVNESGDELSEYNVQQLQDLSPFELGLWVLEELDSRLSALVPGYVK